MSKITLSRLAAAPDSRIASADANARVFQTRGVGSVVRSPLVPCWLRSSTTMMAWCWKAFSGPPRHHGWRVQTREPYRRQDRQHEGRPWRVWHLSNPFLPFGDNTRRTRWAPGICPWEAFIASCGQVGTISPRCPPSPRQYRPPGGASLPGNDATLVAVTRQRSGVATVAGR